MFTDRLTAPLVVLAIMVTAGCSGEEVDGQMPAFPSGGSGQVGFVPQSPTSGAADDPTPTEAPPSPQSESVVCEVDDDCSLIDTGPCAASTCNAVTKTCGLVPLQDGSACDAGDTCTLLATCQMGVCTTLEARDCDDGDPCTDDACVSDSGCVHTYNASPCDDGNPCTADDACSFGACVAGTTDPCDDANPCTNDTCDINAGCQHSPTIAACDDGDPCTVSDTCIDGQCTGLPSDDAACVVEGSCGDGICDPAESCEACPLDCPCPPNPACDAGELADCQGGCSPASALGNGVCDGAFNCQSFGFDNGDCDTNASCGAGQFDCGGGVCIPASKVCDQAVDCVGGLDEQGCGPPPATCEFYEVENCNGGCTLAVWLGDGDCDAALDCAATSFDAGDCVAVPCATDEFTCADGTCLPAVMKCNGELDCDDGSDETGCPGCLNGQLANCSGGCTDAGWFGDGICDTILNCAATGFDGGDCAEETGCASYETLNCVGGCTLASWLGDGECDAALDCAVTNYDSGDCVGAVCDGTEFSCTDGSCVPLSAQCDGLPNCADGSDEVGCPGCLAGQVSNCSGGCTSESWLGDGICDAVLDCAETDYDQGDCAEDTGCASYQTVNCTGGCTLASWLGDGYCDSVLDCAATNYDSGDCGATPCNGSEFSCLDGGCVPLNAQCNGVADCSDGSDEAGCPGCPLGQVSNCVGGCTTASWISDGYCDSVLNCAETNYDGGDCGADTGCASYQMVNCTGGCTLASWLGDGYCDSALNCAATNYDDGDCSGGSGGPSCASYQMVNCTGGCTSASWLGDGYCDTALNCAATNYDAGDCSGGSSGPSCASYQMVNCTGGCTLASWLGDGYCDSALNCAATNYDAGDCAQ